MRKPRASKMGAVKVRAYVGTQDCKFDSKAEYRYALWLEAEREAGRVDQWVHHPGKVTLHGVAGKPVVDMEPDFAVWTPDGTKEYHEVKGMPTAAWRIKRALFEQEYADRYVVIDASHPGDVVSGMLPRLFDDRRRFKSAARKERAAKRERKRARLSRADKNAERFLRNIGRRK